MDAYQQEAQDYSFVQIPYDIQDKGRELEQTYKKEVYKIIDSYIDQKQNLKNPTRLESLIQMLMHRINGLSYIYVMLNQKWKLNVFGNIHLQSYKTIIGYLNEKYDLKITEDNYMYFRFEDKTCNTYYKIY
jgi:hypothetical protein